MAHLKPETSLPVKMCHRRSNDSGHSHFSAPNSPMSIKTRRNQGSSFDSHDLSVPGIQMSRRHTMAMEMNRSNSNSSNSNQSAPNAKPRPSTERNHSHISDQSSTIPLADSSSGNNHCSARDDIVGSRAVTH